MSKAPASWFSWQAGELTLQLSLQPGAKRDEFVGLHGDTLRARIHAPAVDGKANTRLIEFLAEEFATPRSAVQIVRGATARRKTVRVDAPQRLPLALTSLGLVR